VIKLLMVGGRFWNDRVLIQ